MVKSFGSAFTALGLIGALAACANPGANGPRSASIFGEKIDSANIGVATRAQVALEKGDKKIVGVNVHTDSVTHDLEILRVSHEVEVEQVRLLAERKARRDEAAVRSALDTMIEAARTDANLIPPMLEAVRVEATLGEICDALRAEWGEYREPARF